jgi:sulfur transfer protein SufE
MPEFWKDCSSKFKRSIANSVQFQGCTSNMYIAKAFARNFSSVYGQSSAESLAAVCFSQLENEVSAELPDLAMQPALNEQTMEDVISSMKLSMACGPNGLSIEHLK